MSELNRTVFSCRGVHVSAADKEIVKGVDLAVKSGEVHAIMGPNGSGKSTLAAALAGHPSLQASGEIFIDGKPVHELEPFERARHGLFLGFQYPVAIPGVSVSRFLKSAMEAVTGKAPSLGEFRKALNEAFNYLDIPSDFAARYINDGFSGGEKKRIEILQMAMLNPKVAILDETDSGLDIDALKTVSMGINRYHNDNNAILLVTHYQRLLNYVKPDFVHVMMNGHIVKSGGPELALKLEDEGYDWVAQEVGQKVEV